MAIAVLRAETVPDLVSVAQEATAALETILAEAINKVRKLRPGSIETEEQSEAIMEFARRRKAP